MMKMVCQADEDWFSRLPKKLGLPVPEVADCGKGLRYWYFDNGADILAVAHLDSVAGANHFDVVDFSGERRVFSPSLDDRLGAYLILDLLPRMGLKFDILLTTGEETGQSTASAFETDKKYNWTFEFDRLGTDAVMYDYEDDKTANLVEKYGWLVGVGSFTDIVYLEDLGCKGFNFGTGYHDYHSKFAYASMRETAWSVKNFLKFYADLQNTHLPHVKEVKKPWSSTAYDDMYGHWGRGATHTNHVVTTEGTTVTVYSHCEKCNKFIGFPADEKHRICKACLAYYSMCDDSTCKRADCLGVLHCSVCFVGFHGDLSLEKTGVCSYCANSFLNECVLCGAKTTKKIRAEGKQVYVCSECQKDPEILRIIEEETNANPRTS